MNEALGLNLEATYPVGEEVGAQKAANREVGGEPGRASELRDPHAGINIDNNLH